MRWGRVAAVAAVSLSVGGCIPQYVIPEPLYRQLDTAVSFSRLQQDAEQLKGATVALGGVVLDARNLKEGTQIEVLQLPLGAYDQPEGPLESSGGRFLVIDPGRRDPAVLQNRRITIVGQVLGTKVQTVEELEYTYPYLSALFIHLWGSETGNGYRAPYPYYAPYYYPYYTPYYYYSYPYFYGDLYPSWYGSGVYRSAPRPGPYYSPAPRSFGAPPGGMAPQMRPPAPGSGGGMRRYN